MRLLAKIFGARQLVPIEAKRVCQRILCVLDISADKLLRHDAAVAEPAKRCNGCGWTGRAFIDHPEGPTIGCPRCGLVTINDLLSDVPHFHTDSLGRPASFTIDPAVLAYLEPLVGKGMRTLETGAGLSTVLFALRGAHHICITPIAGEAEVVKQYCQKHSISLQEVKFIIERSEDVLPRLDHDYLDMVLIDGGHGFPIPFIDWFYAARLLRPGGLMIVDDTLIKTGRILSEFLEVDPHWKLLTELHNTSIFEKISHGGHLSEWTDQPYTRKDFPCTFQS